jgi:hypothetical protein
VRASSLELYEFLEQIHPNPIREAALNHLKKLFLSDCYVTLRKIGGLNRFKETALYKALLRSPGSLLNADVGVIIGEYLSQAEHHYLAPANQLFWASVTPQRLGPTLCRHVLNNKTDIVKAMLTRYPQLIYYKIPADTAHAEHIGLNAFELALKKDKTVMVVVMSLCLLNSNPNIDQETLDAIVQKERIRPQLQSYFL